MWRILSTPVIEEGGGELGFGWGSGREMDCARIELVLRREIVGGGRGGARKVVLESEAIGVCCSVLSRREEEKRREDTCIKIANTNIHVNQLFWLFAK